jgi:hypothetical protein
MSLDSAEKRAGGSTLTPLGIAGHPLFTAREKIELLQQIKAEITGAAEGDAYRGFSAEEIDEAIARVRQGVQDGVGAGTVLEGDA